MPGSVAPMSSLIEVRFSNPSATYRAGDEVAGVVRVSAIGEGRIGATEVSVLWHTEGKATTDTGLVWFESYPEASGAERESPFCARLPLLPLTYHGSFVKILWVVRVRCLGAFGNDTVVDEPFVVR